MSNINVVTENPVFSLEARKLVKDWLPQGIEREKSQGTWGLGSHGSIMIFDGKPWLWVSSQNKQGHGTKVPIGSLEELRATAISLLVYCEVEEMRMELEKAGE